MLIGMVDMPANAGVVYAPTADRDGWRVGNTAWGYSLKRLQAPSSAKLLARYLLLSAIRLGLVQTSCIYDPRFTYLDHAIHGTDCVLSTWFNCGRHTGMANRRAKDVGIVAVVIYQLGGSRTKTNYYMWAF